MNTDDAVTFLLRYLRNPEPSAVEPDFEFDLYLPRAIDAYLRQERGIEPVQGAGSSEFQSLSPTFLDAAWSLARRGILRLGQRHLRRAQGVISAEGANGTGFSVTPFGRQWISASTLDEFVPIEPGRWGQMLGAYADRFGEGFQSRTQEAVRCYHTQNYLACCVMSGAAAESILLATAREKVGDPEKVLKAYRSSNGRSRVEKMLLGQANTYLRERFQEYYPLVRHWRDEAAHGLPANLSDNEAHTSLLLLYRFAQFVFMSWEDLTARQRQGGGK